MKAKIIFAGIFCLILLAVISSRLIFKSDDFVGDQKITETNLAVSNSGYFDTAVHQSRLSFFGGKFFFDCGDGEVSSIFDDVGREIIPLGAVLVAAKSEYILGSYTGRLSLGSSPSVERKIFFTLMKDGEYNFYLPSPVDPKFLGEKIANEISFD